MESHGVLMRAVINSGKGRAGVMELSVPHFHLERLEFRVGRDNWRSEVYLEDMKTYGEKK